MHMQKVFGIGLSKTGTTSLTIALRTLGYNAYHSPFYAINHANDELSLNFNWIRRGDAFVDMPISFFYKNLDLHFPNSKFILTIRDKHTWLRSCENSHVWPGKYIHDKSIRSWRYVRSVLKLHYNLYGSVWFDRKVFYASYNYHVNNVILHFKNRSSDLLIFDLCNEDRWEDLCAFLGKAIPQTSFPMLNVGAKKKIKRKSLDLFWKMLSALYFGKKMPMEYYPKQSY